MIFNKATVLNTLMCLAWIGTAVLETIVFLKPWFFLLYWKNRLGPLFRKQKNASVICSPLQFFSRESVFHPSSCGIHPSSLLPWTNEAHEKGMHYPAQLIEPVKALFGSTSSQGVWRGMEGNLASWFNPPQSLLIPVKTPWTAHACMVKNYRYYRGQGTNFKDLKVMVCFQLALKPQGL